MIKVERSTPQYLRPNMFFSTQAPYAWMVLVSASDNSVYGSALLRLEFLMRCHAVRTHPKHHGARRLNPFDSIAKITCFLGASRRIVFRIHEQHNRTAREIFESYDVALIIRQGKIGCWIAFAHTPSCMIFHEIHLPNPFFSVLVSIRHASSHSWKMMCMG